MIHEPKRIAGVRFTAMLLLLFVPAIFVVAQMPSDSCKLPASPELKFAPARITLNSTAKNALNALARKLKGAPGCKLSVIAHGYSTYKAQQLGWDRIMTVMEYLYTKGIQENQLIFSNGYEGNPNTVELVATTDDGPHMIPPPYPPASKRKKTK